MRAKKERDDEGNKRKQEEKKTGSEDRGVVSTYMYPGTPGRYLTTHSQLKPNRIWGAQAR